MMLLNSAKSILTCANTSSGIGFVCLCYLPLFLEASIPFYVVDMSVSADSMHWLKLVAKHSGIGLNKNAANIL